MARMTGIERILQNSSRMRQRRKQQAEDLRDLCKIALALVVITIGYFEFAPNSTESENRVVVVASN